jgi:hypothetical protein
VDEEQVDLVEAELVERDRERLLGLGLLVPVVVELGGDVEVVAGEA